MTNETTPHALDKRIRKTLAAVDEAFKNLLSTTEYQKITVSAIAREANINRKTFYLHFSSVDDVLHRAVKQTVEQVIDEVMQSCSNTNPKELLPVLSLAILKDLSRRPDFDENLTQNMPFGQMLDLISTPMVECVSQSYRRLGMEPPERLNYFVACYLGVLISALETWRREGKKESLEDIVVCIQHLAQRLSTN